MTHSGYFAAIQLKNLQIQTNMTHHKMEIAICQAMILKENGSIYLSEGLEHNGFVPLVSITNASCRVNEGVVMRVQ